MNTKKPLKFKTLIIFLIFLAAPIAFMAIVYYSSFLLGPDGEGMRFALGIFSVAFLSLPLLIYGAFTYVYTIINIFRPESTLHRVVAIVASVAMTGAIVYSFS